MIEDVQVELHNIRRQRRRFLILLRWLRMIFARHLLPFRTRQYVAAGIAPRLLREGHGRKQLCVKCHGSPRKLAFRVDRRRAREASVVQSKRNRLPAPPSWVVTVIAPESRYTLERAARHSTGAHRPNEYRDPMAPSLDASFGDTNLRPPGRGRNSLCCRKSR
jgi:hypothetical protein